MTQEIRHLESPLRAAPALRSRKPAMRAQPRKARRNLAASFDDLVGAREDGRGHIEPERLGGLEVDDEFELGR